MRFYEFLHLTNASPRDQVELNKHMSGGADGIRIETAFQYGPRIVVITSREVVEAPADVNDVLNDRAAITLEVAPEVEPDEA